MAVRRIESARLEGIKSVHLDGSMLTEFLDRLDQLDLASPGRRLRQCGRFSYRLKDLVVTLLQPGGTAQTFLVPTRNISATGLSFLHGGFVHIDSACLMQLTTTTKARRAQHGRVIRCRHIEGRIHEVGVRFNRRLDVAMFAHDALERRVLVVDDDPSMRRLFSYYLNELNADVTVVAGGEEAVEEARNNKFDLILMDLDMPGLDGVLALQHLRARGYCGAVIAVTGHAAGQERERCLAEGFDDFREKPVTRQELEDILVGVRHKPIYSTLSEGEEIDRLIAAFVEELGSKVRSLEEASARRDLKVVQCLARSLKGEAGSYGFEPIAESAGKVLEGCASGEQFGAVESEIKKLVDLCQSARSPASTAGAPDEEEFGYPA